MPRNKNNPKDRTFKKAAAEQVDYDKYGHCVKCHKWMIVDRLIEGKIESMFSPEYAETEYFMSDGSRMRVAMCKTCKAGLNEDDSVDVMDSVYRGWETEVNELKHWPEEKKVSHLKRYKELGIVCDSKDLAVDVLDRKLKEFNVKKTKKGKK